MSLSSETWWSMYSFKTNDNESIFISKDMHVNLQLKISLATHMYKSILIWCSWVWGHCEIEQSVPCALCPLSVLSAEKGLLVTFSKEGGKNIHTCGSCSMHDEQCNTRPLDFSRSFSVQLLSSWSHLILDNMQFYDLCSWIVHVKANTYRNGRDRLLSLVLLSMSVSTLSDMLISSNSSDIKGSELGLLQKRWEALGQQQPLSFISEFSMVCPLCLLH